MVIEKFTEQWFQERSYTLQNPEPDFIREARWALIWGRITTGKLTYLEDDYLKSIGRGDLTYGN